MVPAANANVCDERRRIGRGMPKQGEIDYLKRAGESGVQHAMNKPFSDHNCKGNLMQLGAIMHLLPPPPARILDLGCGSGWTSLFLARAGYDVVGQDIAPDMIHCANLSRERDDVSRARFVAADYESASWSSEFDCALFFDALHHAVDERLALQTAFRALRPGGICITSEPGEDHATTREALEAVERFGVTEKDMPYRTVFAIGREVGFRDFRVYPNAFFTAVVLYEDSPKPLFRRLYRIRLLKYLSAAIKLTFFKNFHNIAVMTKPAGGPSAPVSPV
jgi:2-polyprenyl-3-methyl-5-hydroxy-6-metoxy-1,4-benzoquinol methylase